MKIYIHTAHCTKCGKYFKLSYDGSTGYRDPEPCECGGKAKCEMVEKYSDKDPNTKPEFVNIAERECERYSASLGVSESQIDGARKLHPQAEWKKFGHSWRPKIRNRSEKKKLMKQAGLEEYPANYFEQQNN